MSAVGTDMKRASERVLQLGIVAAVTAAISGAAPVRVSADTAVGQVTMYEVNEGLRFLKGRGQRDDDEARAFVQRMAKASLLGTDVSSPTGDPLFRSGSFVAVDATSSVPVSATGVPGEGPLNGKLNMLTDIDPTRESLDTLVITSTLTVKGELDLSAAPTQAFATMSGTWRQSDKKGEKRSGTFQGIFLIPIPIGADADGIVYGYRNLALDGQSTGDLCATAVCPLGKDEFSLGFPLTKALVTFFE